MNISRWCAAGVTVREKDKEPSYSSEHQYCAEIREVEDEAAACGCPCHMPAWMREANYIRLEVCVAGQTYRLDRSVISGAPAGALSWELDRAVGEIKAAAALVSYPASPRTNEEGTQ